MVIILYPFLRQFAISSWTGIMLFSSYLMFISSSELESSYGNKSKVARKKNFSFKQNSIYNGSEMEDVKEKLIILLRSSTMCANRFQICKNIVEWRKVRNKISKLFNRFVNRFSKSDWYHFIKFHALKLLQLILNSKEHIELIKLVSCRNLIVIYSLSDPDPSACCEELIISVHSLCRIVK